MSGAEAAGRAPVQEAAYLEALDFARRVLQPVAGAMDQEDTFPLAVWREFARHGYAGLGIPPAYGGSGGDLLTAALVGRALSRVSPAFALSYGAHLNLCAHNILKNGTDAQKRRYLPELASGRTIGAMALTEPNAGSDATAIRTTAVASKDGYRLNGTKMFITNAPIAGLFVLYAKTRPQAGSEGISAFIVEASSPGLRLARSLDKLGMRGSPTGELVLDDCQVPEENLLGEKDRGVLVMMQGLDAERAFYSFSGVGIAEEALERSIRYAGEAVRDGLAVEAVEAIQTKIADMYVATEAARLLAYEAVHTVLQGQRASRAAAAALLFSGQTARMAADAALEIHQGSGFRRGSVVERFWRDAKLFDIGAGTKEIRRVVLARELTGRR